MALWTCQISFPQRNCCNLQSVELEWQWGDFQEPPGLCASMLGLLDSRGGAKDELGILRISDDEWEKLDPLVCSGNKEAQKTVLIKRFPLEATI